MIFWALLVPFFILEALEAVSISGRFCNPIPLTHFWISATCGENKYFYLVSLLEITREQLLKGPHASRHPTFRWFKVRFVRTGTKMACRYIIKVP